MTKFAAVLGIGMLCAIVASAVWGKGVAVSNQHGVTITLHDDACALKVQLPAKAEWREGRKTYQGCRGIQGGIVVMYFDDDSIAILPVQAFKPLTSL